jgi:hypothetical protein
VQTSCNRAYRRVSRRERWNAWNVRYASSSARTPIAASSGVVSLKCHTAQRGTGLRSVRPAIRPGAHRPTVAGPAIKPVARGRTCGFPGRSDGMCGSCDTPKKRVRACAERLVTTRARNSLTLVRHARMAARRRARSQDFWSRIHKVDFVTRKGGRRH